MIGFAYDAAAFDAMGERLVLIDASSLIVVHRDPEGLKIERELR